MQAKHPWRFVPPWNRSFSMETGDEQSSVWRMMIETRIMIETGLTPPRLPALAERERRTEELLAQPAFGSRHPTSAADSASRQRLCCPPRNHSVGQRSPITLPPGNLVRIVRTFEPFREPIFRPPGTRADLRHPGSAHRGLAGGYSPAYCSPSFLPRGNLVRIVRTFEPFRAPIFLPPDTVLRAECGDGANSERFADGTDTFSAIATSSCDRSDLTGSERGDE